MVRRHQTWKNQIKERTPVKIVDLSRELYHRTPNYPGHSAIIHGHVENA